MSDPDRHSSEPKKKRIRVSYSCTQCKKRKIKCSRDKPTCLSCFKANITDCFYEQPDWSRLLAQEGGNVDISPHSHQTAANSNSNISPSSSSPSVNQKSPGNGDLLKNDIEMMKDMIMKLEERIKKGGDDPNNSEEQLNNTYGAYYRNGAIRTSYNEIFPSIGSIPDDLCNEKLEVWRPSTLFHKMTRTLYFGSSAMRTDLTLDEPSSRLAPFFMRLVSKERSKFKAEMTKHLEKSKSSILINNDSINSTSSYDTLDESLFAENVHRRFPTSEHLSELLKYFEANLIWHFPFIEMPMVWTYFRDYFKSNEDGSLSLVKPAKPSFYSQVAVVLGIATLSLLFSNVDDSVDFEYFPGELLGNNQVHDLFVQSLKISRFMKKQSLPALQALLLLRALQIYDTQKSDGGDETNSYLYFQSAISMAFSIGLHRDPDKMSFLSKKDEFTPLHMSRETWRETWRYISTMDITYSVTIGTPLMIRDDMTDCTLTNTTNTSVVLDKGYRVLKNIAYHMFTKVAGLSLNEIVDLLNDLLKFMCFEIESFESLLIDSPGNAKRQDEICALVGLKLECLYHVVSLSNQLKLVTRIHPSVINAQRQTPLTEKEILFLESISNYYDFEGAKASVFAFIIMEKLSNPDSSLKAKPNLMILLLAKMRKLLTRAFFFFLIHALDPQIASTYGSGPVKIASTPGNHATQPSSDGGNTDSNGSSLAGTSTKNTASCSKNPCSNGSGENASTTEPDSHVLKCSAFTYDLEYAMYDKFMNYKKTTRDQVQLLRKARNNCRDVIAFLCEVSIKCMNNTPAFAKDYGFYVSQRSLLVACWYAEVGEQRRAKINDLTMKFYNGMSGESTIFSEATQFVSNSIQKEGEANPGDFQKFFVDDPNPKRSAGSFLGFTNLDKVRGKGYRQSKPSTPYDALRSVVLRSSTTPAVDHATESVPKTTPPSFGMTPRASSIIDSDDSLDQFLDLNDRSQEFYNWLLKDFDSGEFSKYLSSLYSTTHDGTSSSPAFNNDSIDMFGS